MVRRTSTRTFNAERARQILENQLSYFPADDVREARALVNDDPTFVVAGAWDKNVQSGLMPGARSSSPG